MPAKPLLPEDERLAHRVTDDALAKRLGQGDPLAIEERLFQILGERQRLEGELQRLHGLNSLLYAPQIPEWFSRCLEPKGPQCFTCERDSSSDFMPVHLARHDRRRLPNSAADDRRYRQALAAGVQEIACFVVICRDCCADDADPMPVFEARLRTDMLKGDVRLRDDIVSRFSPSAGSA